MKKLSMLLAGLFFVAILGLSKSFGQQVNDPNAEVREAKNFHGINVSSAFDVYINQSNEESIAVSASQTKYRDRIKVEVKEGILHVWYDNKMQWNMGDKKLKAYISFKNIDKLQVSGACDVIVSGSIKANDLQIDLSGASDLKGKLEVKNLSVDLSGASDMTVTGIASQTRVEASGASEFKGYDLVAEVCDAKASGASDIKITVNKELSAEASGASDVHYKGDGVIKELKTSGASSISKTRS